MSDWASVTFLEGLAAAVEGTHVDFQSVLSRAGLDPNALDGCTMRVPLDRARAAWLAAAELSGDLSFGLHAAERVGVGPFDLLDYLTRTSATFGHALERYVRYAATVTTVGKTALTVERGVVSVTHTAVGALSHVSELTWATIVLRGRELTQSALDPLTVGFMHPPPHDHSEHARIFRAPVHFGQATDLLCFSESVLDLPFRSAEPRLGHLLERQARLLLADMPASDSFVPQVAALIADGLPSDRFDLRDIARRLHMSRRTLQRRLAEAGTSHQNVVDSVRCRLAHHYLDERRMSPLKVAHVLGFSDSSALRRARKRWQTSGEARSQSHS